MVASVRQQPDGQLRYSSAFLDEDIEFTHTLACEVGEIIKPLFEDFFASHTVESRKLQSPPWCADFIL